MGKEGERERDGRAKKRKRREEREADFFVEAHDEKEKKE